MLSVVAGGISRRQRLWRTWQATQRRFHMTLQGAELSLSPQVVSTSSGLRSWRREILRAR